MSTVEISARDGSGRFDAYMVAPPAAPAPAIILIQEIFGINANMRTWCENLAAQGYLTICPDLFWRQEPGVQLTDQTEAEWQHAFKLYQGFDLDKGMEDLSATLDFVKSHPACNGKVGCVGFCLGGRLAVLMSARTAIDVSVSYYGVALDQHVNEFRNIHQPLLIHVAGLDKYVPPEVLAILRNAVKDLAGVELHVYDGVDHAFARINGQNFNAEAATLANQRTGEFLQRHLRQEGTQNL